MRNNILFAFALIILGLPAFSKSNFSYVAVNTTTVPVAYHANNIQYASSNADIYSFDEDAPLYQLQADVASVNNDVVASIPSQTGLNNTNSKGNVDYITFPYKNKFSVGKTAGVILGMAAACALDPYIVEIDGNKYVMILDNFDGIYNENDIIGIEDSKSNIFNSLKKLNVDNDKTKLTSSELKERGVRFVKIELDGRLAARDYTQDFCLENIVYIDLVTLKKVKNVNHTGVFGEFKIVIKDKKTTIKEVKGYVTYESPKDLAKLF